MGILPEIVWSQHQENPWVAFCHPFSPVSGGQYSGERGWGEGAALASTRPPHPLPLSPEYGGEGRRTARPRRTSPVVHVSFEGGTANPYLKWADARFHCPSDGDGRLFRGRGVRERHGDRRPSAHRTPGEALAP